MDFIPRAVRSTIEQLVRGYPVIVITGPRQSGKTTLVRELFADHPYVSLEDLDALDFAQNDPRGFLAQYPDGAVFDEVQRCPELFCIDLDPDRDRIGPNPDAGFLPRAGALGGPRGRRA